MPIRWHSDILCSGLGRAATALLLNWLTPDLNCGRPGIVHWLARHPILDRSSHSHESLYYISCVLCTGFHKRNTNFIGKCLGSFIWHSSVGSKITLISNQKFVDIITSIAINFI
uniref:Uncharacterized protein n=1 Tax=Opuntia streptacantha TaxID=393608 RepID=A0A7C8YJW3_OPUST